MGKATTPNMQDVLKRLQQLEEERSILQTLSSYCDCLDHGYDVDG